jgi:hypothetical protein
VCGCGGEIKWNALLYLDTTHFVQAGGAHPVLVVSYSARRAALHLYRYVQAVSHAVLCSGPFSFMYVCIVYSLQRDIG